MEPEENKNSKLKSQIQALRSGNHSAILSTLKELRVHGDISILPDLFEVMLGQEDEHINSEITMLLNDLKDQEAAEVLSEAIKNPELRELMTPLVAACWQNGLSYGKHIDTFVEVLITGEYTAAIEAFTVIEEAVGELEQAQRDHMAKQLKSKLQEVESLKKPLLSELVKVIERY